MNKVNVGDKFNFLTFVELLPPRGAGKNRHGLWHCDCGNEKALSVSCVRTGRLKSCGCYRTEVMRKYQFQPKHGMKGTPEWRSWHSMNQRCGNPNHGDYHRYGGAGISVCSEWKNSFSAFFEHIGPRPTGTTLDRIDRSRGYEPGNVRWASRAEQVYNRKNMVRINTPVGEMTVAEYANRLGIKSWSAHRKMRQGKLDGCSYA